MRCYVVDAFAEHIFEGNPAAVCVLEQWLSDEMMQNIAIENNLSETAFTVKEGDCYKLRWFTPGGEIDLCGHATLATTYVLSRFFEKETTEFHFQTLSGELIVVKKGDLFEMDFPSVSMESYPLREEMVIALGGVIPVEVQLGKHLVFVLENEEVVANLTPDFAKLRELQEGLGAFVTAPSEQFDYVARAFFPKLDVNEDPVCGSMFCNLIPYWERRLGKVDAVARQLSKRGGMVYCKACGERVKISGTAVLYSIAELQIPE